MSGPDSQDIFEEVRKSITIKKFELTLELITDCVSNLCWALGNNEHHKALNSHLEFLGPLGIPGQFRLLF